MGDRSEQDATAAVIESQKRFYDLRAPDYLTGAASDRVGAKPDQGMPADTRRQLVDEVLPFSAVLELGCGPGGFTRELARHASEVTALDAAPRMLERNRLEVGASNVRYVEADLFDWEPGTTYDLVFFGFVVSHIPPDRFDTFWDLVRRCLMPTGRVAFVDEARRVAHYDDVRVEHGIPLARRRLVDGREFDIVKV